MYVAIQKFKCWLCIPRFKKGDIIYVKRQVDSNWYEGERNAMIGIFPTTYVEVIPEGEVSSLR